MLDTSPNSRNEGLVEFSFRDSIFSRADRKPLTRHSPSLRTHVFLLGTSHPRPLVKSPFLALTAGFFENLVGNPSDGMP